MRGNFLSIPATENVKEGLAFSGKLTFQFLRMVAIAASPRFFAIEVSATFSIESVLHPNQIKKRFPVRPLFRETRIAETNLDPLDPAISVDTSLFHVP
jgi:hypothetical protein